MSLTIDPTVGLEVASDAVARAVKAGADQAKAVHVFSQAFEVNFDTNDVTLVRSTVTDQMSLTAFVAGAKGTSDLTGRSPDAVDDAAAAAIVAAQAGAPDPANVLPEDEVARAQDSGDVEPDEDAMVATVMAHVARMKAEHPLLRSDSSMYQFVCSWTSYANSFGRTQQARKGVYLAQTMVTGKDGERATSFNYDGVAAMQPIADLTSLPSFASLIRDTEASFDAKPVPATFVGDVIFTPGSLMTLLGSVLGSVSGAALMRKASPYLEALGTAIGPTGLTVRHAPGEVAASSPFDAEGFLEEPRDIIRGGVLESFLIDWYFSHKLGRPMTGGSANLVVEAGDVSLEEIIASTEKGIVLGRFSGGMPNANLDFSGVAKNSFYVEDGKVVGPIAETMVAGSFKDALAAITKISTERIDNGSHVFPWVASTGITVSTK